MIHIKTEQQIENIRYSAGTLGKILAHLKTCVRPGISLVKLDSIAEEMIYAHGGVPAFKGFMGFPNTACISVNEDVIHGIPSNYCLKEGDIVGIDIGMIYKKAYGDTAYTYAVGEVSSEISMLLQKTREALYRGIDAARHGNRVGDISYAIESHVKGLNYGIVREYTGHGVGIQLWEEPSIPNYGLAGVGPRLKKNMVIAIEPMFSLGNDKVFVKKDKWTVATIDKKWAAHFEHTLLVRDGNPEILSAWPSD